MREKIKKMELNTAFVCQFAMDDFKTKYAGSILGLIWAFIQPIITVVIYWFIFQVGFNNDAVSGYPFILWLVAGLAPWMFISDAIVNATNSLVEYSYFTVGKSSFSLFYTSSFSGVYYYPFSCIWVYAEYLLAAINLLYDLYGCFMRRYFIFYICLVCIFKRCGTGSSNSDSSNILGYTYCLASRYYARKYSKNNTV